MKNSRKFFGTVVILFTLALFLAPQANSQTPPPPNNNGAGSGSPGNTVVGGGAPVGSGLLILSLMAAAYGGLKLRNQKLF